MPSALLIHHHLGPPLGHQGGDVQIDDLARLMAASLITPRGQEAAINRYVLDDVGIADRFKGGPHVTRLPARLTATRRTSPLVAEGVGRRRLTAVLTVETKAIQQQ